LLSISWDGVTLLCVFAAERKGIIWTEFSFLPGVPTGLFNPNSSSVLLLSVKHTCIYPKTIDIFHKYNLSCITCINYVWHIPCMYMYICIYTYIYVLLCMYPVHACTIFFVSYNKFFLLNCCDWLKLRRGNLRNLHEFWSNFKIFFCWRFMF